MWEDGFSKTLLSICFVRLSLHHFQETSPREVIYLLPLRRESPVFFTSRGSWQHRFGGTHMVCAKPLILCLTKRFHFGERAVCLSLRNSCGGLVHCKVTAWNPSPRGIWNPVPSRNSSQCDRDPKDRRRVPGTLEGDAGPGS